MRQSTSTDHTEHQPELLPPSKAPAASTDPKAKLLAEYRRLVRVELPQVAQISGWSLRLDHCFARVILDDLFGGCWYGYLKRGRGRSAESQLDAGQLRRAIKLARGMLKDGEAEIRRLDAQSLRWRGKPPKAGRACG